MMLPMPEKPRKREPLSGYGSRLKTELDRSGTSQRALARRAQVGEPQISRLISGTVGLEGENLLHVLKEAAAMGVSLDFVIRGVPSSVVDLANHPEFRRAVQTVVQQERSSSPEEQGDGLSKPPRARNRRR